MASDGLRSEPVSHLALDAGGGSRRERIRSATVAEIKRLAWAQVAEGGALAVSLRAIARSMGMTSSALYRYFASHEQLLLELGADGFASLADALVAAEEALPAGISAEDGMVLVAGAHRLWALEHSTEYALIFGTPMCANKDNERIVGEYRRGVDVLFRVMISALEQGELDAARLPPVSPALAARFESWQEDLEVPLPSEALAACMFVWAQLHGAIALEVFEQLPPHLVPADALFDYQMRLALRTLYQAPTPEVVVAQPARPRKASPAGTS
jgi:AcrR family transcriptional regulator